MSGGSLVSNPTRQHTLQVGIYVGQSSIYHIRFYTSTYMGGVTWACVKARLLDHQKCEPKIECTSGIGKQSPLPALACQRVVVRVAK